jgi:cell shape-determining protein MreC
MNGKEALQNIGIEFDTMGMICTNIGYEEFYNEDLHFNKIFKTETNIIKQDLKRLEKLEKENKELKNKIKLLESEKKYIVQAYRILKEVLYDRV